MKTTQAPLVRPANPELAKVLAERARGSRAGTHGRRTRRDRAGERRRYMDFERRAA